MAGCHTASDEKKSAPPKESVTEVQKAVGSIIGSVTGQEKSAQYCPVCGKHFGLNVKICPADGTELKEIED